jgi:hypothetical protein
MVKKLEEYVDKYLNFPPPTTLFNRCPKLIFNRERTYLVTLETPELPRFLSNISATAKATV